MSSENQSRNYKNEIIVVFGQRGTGKSTFLCNEMERHVPFCFIDPLLDPKFSTSNVYKIYSMEDAFRMFREGKPLRLYAAPDIALFDYFCGLCLAHGDITLIVDEIDNYSDSHYLTPWFRKCVKYGRHKGVNIIVAARRPKDMNLTLRGQANKFVIFPMGGEDAKDLQPYIGDCHKQILELRSNENGSEYLEYTFTGKTLEKKSLKYIKI